MSGLTMVSMKTDSRSNISVNEVDWIPRNVLAAAVCMQCRINITYVSTARFAVGGRAHEVILARVYAFGGVRLAYFVGSHLVC